MLRLTNNPGTDTALKLAAVACVMFAFVFVVMVPLYDVMCDVLGINGKTSGSAYTAVPAQVDTSRQVTVQFIATNNDGMPWIFRPEVRQLTVHPGEAVDMLFHATNPTGAAMVAQAIPSVTPSRAAAYFHKTECFCFDQQPLDGRSAAEMPLQFVVDQALPGDIRTITLSYTLFDVTDMTGDKIAAR